MDDQDAPPVTSRLGRFAAEAPLASLPAAVTGPAQLVMTDTIACMLGGWASDVAGPTSAYLAATAGSAESAIVGSARRTDRATAALVNGTLGHALDYDDVVRTMPGHPSVAVLAALAAEASRAPASVDQVLRAYIVGVEVAVAVGRGMGVRHSKRWHSTSTCAGFGATAALSRLRGLDARTATYAIGIVASLTSGLKHSFGTMTKPLHAGWAAHQAMLAVDLAQAGFTSSTSIMEASDGFVAVLGDKDSSLAAMLERLGDPWVFAAPGVALKLYPCCGAAHRGIDAALEVRAKLAAGDNITRIRCFTPVGSLHVMPYTRPKDGLQGKFSLDYCIAAALLDGDITFGSFTDDAVLRPEIAGLYERMEIIEDPDCWPADHPPNSPDSPPYEGFLRLEVESAGGERYEHSVEQSPGSPLRPVSPDDVERKFTDCAIYAGATAEAARRSLARLSDPAGDFADALVPVQLPA